MLKKSLLYTTYYTCLFGSIYTVFVGYNFWKGLVITMSDYIKRYNAYGYLIFVSLGFVFTTLPFIIIICVYRRKYLNKPIQQRNENTALIIPCHRAESVIGKTLEKALCIFDPESIFVIDNGNSDSPLDNTKTVCENLGVNYTWSNVGSKISSIYIGTKLAKDYSYVMQIDDDIFLEEDMTFPIDDTIDCIAYTISAISKDGSNNLLQKCQDVEYKIAGITKGVHSWLGNTSFAHGAISLWKRESLIKVLDNHPMYPISDDWFIGFMANTYGMRIEVCDQKFISTDTPRTLCWGGRTSGYGSATLLKQRFGRWYALIALETVYNLYYVFFVWSFSFRRVIFQKLFILWHSMVMTMILFRYLIFAYSIYISYMFPLIMLAVSIGFWVLHFIIFNTILLQKEERFDLSMLFVFPVFKIQDSIVCITSSFYGIFYKIPIVLIEERINLQENQKIKKILETKNKNANKEYIIKINNELLKLIMNS